MYYSNLGLLPKTCNNVSSIIYAKSVWKLKWQQELKSYILNDSFVFDTALESKMDSWSPVLDLVIYFLLRNYRVILMVVNATFNNISALSWHSVLLVEETWVSRENHLPVASNWHTLSHNVVPSTPCYQTDSNSQLKWW
jgi:hypothetical protein